MDNTAKHKPQVVATTDASDEMDYPGASPFNLNRPNVHHGGHVSTVGELSPVTHYEPGKVVFDGDGTDFDPNNATTSHHTRPDFR